MTTSGVMLILVAAFHFGTVNTVVLSLSVAHTLFVSE
jgi:hypothetical protein